MKKFSELLFRINNPGLVKNDIHEGNFSPWHSDTINDHKVTAHHNYNSGTDSIYTGKVNGKKWKHSFDNSAAHHGMREGDWVHKNNPHLTKDEAHAVAKYQDKHWELHEHVGSIVETFDKEIAGVSKKSQTYADNPDDEHEEGSSRFESNMKKFNSALMHIKSKGYKVNRDDEEPKHKKPDVTLHVAMGDDSPHAYTVHHSGAAASDKKLHHKDLHVGPSD